MTDSEFYRQQLLKYRAASPHARLKQYRLANGEKVWIRCGSHDSHFLQRNLLRLFSRLPLGLLTPLPPHAAPWKIEKQRLEKLSAAGVAVPKVLACDGQALMMSHVPGDSLQVMIEQSNAHDAIQYWQDGIQALLTLHQKQQYLSYGFARNMLRQSGKITFIDFEDDPGEKFSLCQCQSRDWLCYLHSTVIYLQQKNPTKTIIRIRQQTLARLPVGIREQLNGYLTRLRCLSCLRHPRWGRDILRLSALLAFYFS